MRRHRSVSLLSLALWGAAIVWSGTAFPDQDVKSERGTFVRAKIEMGEAMGRYMRELRASGRTMDNYEQMSVEINAMMADILKSYGLTIKEYRARARQLFADDAALNTFLDEHPDLKQRYKAIKQRPPGDSSGRP